MHSKTYFGIVHLLFVAALQISCPMDKTSLLTLTLSVSHPDSTIVRNLLSSSGMTSEILCKYSADGGHDI